MYRIERFWVPEDGNLNDALDAYADDGVPTFNTITGSNIALIKLATVITPKRYGAQCEFKIF